MINLPYIQRVVSFIKLPGNTDSNSIALHSTAPEGIVNVNGPEVSPDALSGAVCYFSMFIRDNDSK